MNNPNPPSPAVRVSLWRRLAAGAYDGLVVLALMFLGTALIMPLSRGAITPDHLLAELLFQAYLLTIGFMLFAGFWIRDGQTMGMLAWRVKLVRSDGGSRVSWKQALVRYLAAILSWLPLGLGFWWSLFDPEQKTWHDKLSGTELHIAKSFTEISNRQSP